MHLLLRKILNILLHLEKIHTHTLDRACVRFSRRSREESQLQAEPDQDNCNNSDSVMRAHKVLRLQVPGIRVPAASAIRTNPNVEAILCLPTAADCQFVS